MGFQFLQTSLGDIQKPNVVTRAIPAISLGDIGRNGTGGAANLAREAEELVLWKMFRQAIKLQREKVAALSDFDLTIVFHVRKIGVGGLPLKAYCLPRPVAGLTNHISPAGGRRRCG